jgi:hypothetical protein
MSKKIDRSAQGPSGAEIILGIALSALFGIALGAASLISRPVVSAKVLPEEIDPKAVYYLEGTRDTAKARQSGAKRTAFVQGQSVSVIEDELNTLAVSVAAPAAAAKPGEPPAAAPTEMIVPGTPNFRIRDGILQVGVPVKVNVAGAAYNLVVQARGGFEKQGDRFVFAPDTLYLGSCPVQRVPLLAGYVRSKFLEAQAIPEDIASAWGKLANVAIEGSTLTLTMP